MCAVGVSQPVLTCAVSVRLNKGTKVKKGAGESKEAKSAAAKQEDTPTNYRQIRHPLKTATIKTLAEKLNVLVQATLDATPIDNWSVPVCSPSGCLTDSSIVHRRQLKAEVQQLFSTS